MTISEAALEADEPASGKSRALEVLGSLCRKPALVADVTGPARKLEFARDAGAVAVWVRFGSGPVTAPGRVAVIDLR